MVYRGKPSAACAECRKRRNRCDYNVPSCGQCTRTGRKCSGYRNLTDLLFHDQTEQVSSKIKSQTWSVSNATTPKTYKKTPNNQAMQIMAVESIRFPKFVMHQPPEDLGVKFFMSNYVGEAPALSMLNYLPEFYSKTGYASQGLQQSIVATGLAGFAKASGRTDMQEQATRCYVSAIRGINGALADMRGVSQDSTLMAIIMSAVFEIITSSSVSGTQNCSKHLAGAVSVASLMMEQKQTVFTQRILATLVQCVIMNCQIQNEPPPKGFVELKSRVGGAVHAPTVHEIFLDIVAELADFELAMKKGDMDCAEGIIEKASALDEALVEFARNMPSHWRFEEFRLDSADAAHLAYGGYFHVYPQRFTALLWNNIRSMRLRLHQIILHQCQLARNTSQESRTAQEDHSKTVIVTLAKDMAATIPQLTGYLEQLQPYFDDTPRGQQAPAKHRFQLALDSAMLETADNDSVAMVQIIPHHLYSDATKAHATSPLTSSSSASSSPSSTYSPQSPPTPNTTPTPHPRSATLFHTLFQLHALRSSPHLNLHLPSTLTSWLTTRIAYIERVTDPHDVAYLRLQLGVDAEGARCVMPTYDFSRKLQIRGGEEEGEEEAWSRCLMW